MPTEEGGVGHTGADAIGANTLACVIQGQRFGELEDAAFRGAIGDQALLGHVRVDAADGDNGTALMFDHLWEHRPHRFH